jgi:spore maturation protein CgeB
MRIFCAVRHAKDARRFKGGLWSANFYPALRQMGHEIIESQIDLEPTSTFMHISDDFTAEELEERARTTEQILIELRAVHRRTPVDLFLSYFYNSHFDPSGFDELRHLGIVSINFFCNSIYQFDLVSSIAAKADFAWHAEKDARESYLAVGANPIWVQMAADPTVYFPLSGEQRNPDSCFVGQRYADRDRWIAFLIRAALPVVVYGSGWTPRHGSDFLDDIKKGAQATHLGRRTSVPGSWQNSLNAATQNVRQNNLFAGVRRSVNQLLYRRETRSLTPLVSSIAKGPAAEITTTFSEHEICLNFSNVWADGRVGSSLIPHVRLRDFEGPMCRTCYLTGHTEEITEFYEVGREIDTYRTPEELAHKVRFYLSHAKAAEELREAGYRRALRQHTWNQRFVELFSKSGLSS